nr:hypothetical protein [Providencia stuartii]
MNDNDHATFIATIDLTFIDWLSVALSKLPHLNLQQQAVFKLPAM